MHHLLPSRGTRRAATALALTLAAAIATLLHPSSSTASAVKHTPVASSATSSLGRILVDGQGRTLYLFEKDTMDTSTCAGSCAGYWPPLLTTARPLAATGVRAGLLGTTRRTDGTLQVTYNHHPLYRFKLDAKAGQTRGQNLHSFGADWYVLSPAGVKIEKRTTNGQSGNGYSRRERDQRRRGARSLPSHGRRRVRLENGFWGASCPRRVLIALPRRSWSLAVIRGVPWSCCAAPRTTSRSSLRTCTYPSSASFCGTAPDRVAPPVTPCSLMADRSLRAAS